MTDVLPTPLSYMILSYIVDEKDTVEGYLSQDPRADSGFPIILRNMFFGDKSYVSDSSEECHRVSERNAKWNLEPAGIPDAATTLRYLQELFSFKDNTELKILTASTLGLTYIIPYLFPENMNFNVKTGQWRLLTTTLTSQSLLEGVLSMGLERAVKNGYLDTARLLHRMGANTGYTTREDDGQYVTHDILSHTIQHHDIPATLAILDMDSETFRARRTPPPFDANSMHHITQVVRFAYSVHDSTSPLVAALVSAYSHELIHALVLAATNNDRATVSVLFMTYPKEFRHAIFDQVFDEVSNDAGLHTFGVATRDKMLDSLIKFFKYGSHISW